MHKQGTRKRPHFIGEEYFVLGEAYFVLGEEYFVLGKLDIYLTVCYSK